MKAENVLEIENLTLSFHGPQGRVEAVRGVTLSVAPGEVVALVGESGCGKTALCRAVMMLHSRHAQIEEGAIRLCGKDVTRMSEQELEKVRGRDAAMIFQDPMSSLNPTFSIGAQIMEPMRLHQRISRSEARKRAAALLAQVGIAEPEMRMRQYPHHFSGGMRQRVAIAIAMAADPRLIIADEPTTALDIGTQERIMALLKALFGAGRKSMLFVTHDLSVAREIADRVAVMKDGLIVEIGRTEEIFSAPQHAYTKQLLGYANYGKASSHHHGHLSGEKEVAMREPAEPRSDVGVQGAGAQGSDADALGSGTMMEIRDLCKVYPLGRRAVHPVLKNVSFSVQRGEIVGLVGDSGCGKSTLARCIMGIETPSGGEIRLAEDCRPQMIFQDSASAFDARMTIGEIIAEPLTIAASRLRQRRDKKGVADVGRLTKEEIHRRVAQVMGSVELEQDLALRHPYDVSGGQRQRAAIARALITRPNFLLADEPISSLDVSVQAQIVHLLRRLSDEQGLTILLIAHDLPMVEHVSDRIERLAQD